MSLIDEKADELRKLRADLDVIEMAVVTSYTLADAIREGAQVTTQAQGWGSGAQACALTAAVHSARSRDFL